MAGIVCIVLSLISVIWIARYIWADDIWYDEVFSLGFIRGDIGYIADMTGRDVHPPLYYIYLKAVSDLITLILGDTYLIPAAKLASVLPWIGLAVLALTYIRVKYGLLTSGAFLLAVTAMPQLPTYYVEIRMYSLALLLVTAAVLAALKITEDIRARIPWMALCVIGILTAYTQYYACIAIIGIYAVLLIMILIYGGEHKRSGIGAWLVSVLISVAAYIPWLGRLRSQIDGISGNYWIQPLTIRSIAGCAKFILLPVVYAGIWPYVSAALTAAAVCILAVRYTRVSGKGEALNTCVICVAPLVCTILAGFILSALGTPIFIYRYMIPTLGGLWLYVGICTGRCADRGAWRLLILPLILSCILTMKGYSAEEGGKLTQMRAAEEALDRIPEGSVIIANFDHVAAVLGYMRPKDRIYLYDAEIDGLIPDICGNVYDSLEDGDIPELIKTEPHVFFMGSFNSRDEITAKWEDMGIRSELKDSVMIERYWINIYDLSEVTTG